MVSLPIEPFRWTPEVWSLPDRPRAHGGGVVDQRPAPQPLLGRRLPAVQVLHAVQMVIEPAQQPVHRVARPMTAGRSVRPREGPSLVTRRQHLLPHDWLIDLVRGPLPQAAKPLRERTGIRGRVCTPDPLPQRIARLLQVLGPMTDLQERMQEAEDRRHALEPRLPSRLRAAQPSVLMVWGRSSGSRSRASSRTRRRRSSGRPGPPSWPRPCPGNTHRQRWPPARLSCQRTSCASHRRPGGVATVRGP